LLALQEGRPLATHDAALRTAADQADVALFGLEPSVALA
jgi:hypothetical protein